MIESFQTLFAPPRHLILLILALWAGLALAERRAERYGVNKDHLSNLVFYSLLAFLLGGRIGFVLENISVFLRSPLDILSLSPSIFDPLSACLAALLTGAVYARRQALPFWPLMDSLTPVFALTALGLGLSHLAAESAYGKLTDLPWGIATRGAVRHPAQLYEITAALLILGWVWFKKPDARPGLSFLTFVSLTAAARLFLEAYRGDSGYLPGGYREPQVLAWIVLAFGFLLIDLILKAPPGKQKAPR